MYIHHGSITKFESAPLLFEDLFPRPTTEEPVSTIHGNCASGKSRKAPSPCGSAQTILVTATKSITARPRCVSRYFICNSTETGTGKRKITVHEPPPSALQVCKDPIFEVDNAQRALLDPTGARARLFDPENKEGAKVGDILLTTFKTGEPFSGVILSIKQRGIHTSVLLRNQLTRIGTEMSIKVYSPLVQSMEVAQKAVKRKRRARLYYLRKPKHDVGSVEKVVDQYLRQRALLTGGKLGSQYGSRRPTA